MLELTIIQRYKRRKEGYSYQDGLIVHALG